MPFSLNLILLLRRLATMAKGCDDDFAVIQELP
jgi:hypothetical protein